MKGQTQAVTAILLTGITIGAVTTVFVWGTPILEKRQGQAGLQTVEEDVLSIYNEIVSVSRGGSGTASTVELDLSNSGSEIRSVWVNPTEDYINITVDTAQSPPYPAGTWTMLKGSSLQDISIGAGEYGIKGKELPGVVMVRAYGSGISRVTYRIEFRNLYAETPSGSRLEKIDLEAVGGQKSAGQTTLRVSNGGTEFDTGGSAVTLSSGEKIDRRRTVVEIDLR